MTKVKATTLQAAKIAARVLPQVASTIPRPVDDTGATPQLWTACTGYEVDHPALTVDDQDLVTAIGKAPGKITASDNTRGKLVAKLAQEIAAAKVEREGKAKKV